MNPSAGRDDRNAAARAQDGRARADDAGGMKPLGELLPKIRNERSRKTERGELMRFFTRHLNHARKQDGLSPVTMARMGKILEGIPTNDLYYLQSVCTRAKHFSKKFWWELDPKKHYPENPFRQP
ncbi:MAG: hypothetical protein KGI41_03125 [Patescibacteria group bacterium]|nr:hypothetical protein [Patescibacteria group bacterium]MDE1966207.1 hypothetical protein [Patescibacteria group bacterium]